jgi:hypothetical protein
MEKEELHSAPLDQEKLTAPSKVLFHDGNVLVDLS